jgi:hypothetical protein
MSGTVRGDIRAATTVDIDGDGLAEIAVGTTEGNVCAFGLEGSRKIDVDLGSTIRVMANGGTAPDGTGRIVAIASDGRVYLVQADGIATHIGDVATTCDRVVVADLDGDGTLEAIVGGDATLTYEILVIGLDGSHRTWSRGSDFVRGLLVADLDGDGVPEIVDATWNQRLRVLSKDGTLRTEWPLGASGLCVALGRKLGSKPSMLFAGTDDKLLVGVDVGGGERFRRTMEDSVGADLCVDFEGNGEEGVIAGAANGQILAFDASGRRLFESTVGSIVAGIVTIDLDGDGKPEIAAAGVSGRVVLLGRDGSSRGTIDTRSQIRNILVADIDGNGADDLILTTGSSQIEVHTFDRDLKLARSLGVAVTSVDGFRDGNGQQLAARGRGGEVEILGNDGSFVREIRTDSASRLAVGNRDGDADAQIVVSSANDGLRAYSPRGDQQWKSPSIPGGIMALDSYRLGGESRDSTFVTTDARRVMVVDATGSVRLDLQMPRSASRAGAVAVASRPGECFASVPRDGIVGFDLSGAMLWRIPVPLIAQACSARFPGGEGGWAAILDDGMILWIPREGLSAARRIGRIRGQCDHFMAVDLDGDGIPEILAATFDGEIVAFSADGCRIFFRSVGYHVYRLAAVDLDGDGRAEIVGALGERNEVAAWSIPNNDPRPRLRRRFLEGLEAAERGDETGATPALEEARFRWATLDDTDLEAIRARLEFLTRSRAARRMLGILNRSHPPNTARRIEALRDLVVTGHPVVAEAAARRWFGEATLPAGMARPLNEAAWSWIDPICPIPNARNVALVVAEAAVRACGRGDVAILDTLAQALFANGKRAEAISIEEEAIAKCRSEDKYLESQLQAALARFREAAVR